MPILSIDYRTRPLLRTFVILAVLVSAVGSLPGTARAEAPTPAAIMEKSLSATKVRGDRQEFGGIPSNKV